MYLVIVYILLSIWLFLTSVINYPKAVTKNGIFYYDPMDKYIAEAYKNNQIFEEDMVNSKLLPIIKNCKIVVDLGANIGTHCISYGNHNRECIIYAFEPQKQIYKILELNIHQNDLQGIVIPINKAVSHEKGKLKLEKVPEDTPFNKGGVGFNDNGGEEVDVITLDSLDLNGCDFIKMDIQGAEPLAIIGGEKTIKKFKPKIMFEYDGSYINPAHVNLDKIPDTKQLLESYGYDISSIDGANFMAIPKI